MRVEALDQQAFTGAQFLQVLEAAPDLGEIVMQFGNDKYFCKHNVLLEKAGAEKRTRKKPIDLLHIL
jgi:hypothetical protein